ncbi:MAG: zinc ribbon domain-containing protein [Clostridiales bacterium]|nr:zinc ribbon domain-containing protein [Candidatus Apopatousia equi]
MEDKKLCSVCFTELKENDNFCPACGEPLTELAKELVSEQKVNTELALLVKLIDYIDDEKTLKFIDGLVKKLSE